MNLSERVIKLNQALSFKEKKGKDFHWGRNLKGLNQSLSPHKALIDSGRSKIMFEYDMTDSTPWNRFGNERHRYSVSFGFDLKKKSYVITIEKSEGYTPGESGKPETYDEQGETEIYRDWDEAVSALFDHVSVRRYSDWSKEYFI
jgi:hypothetical protein